MKLFFCVFLVHLTADVAMSVSPLPKYLLRFPGESDRVEESNEVLTQFEQDRREQCRCDTLWSLATRLAIVEEEAGFQKSLKEMGIKIVSMKYENQIIPRSLVPIHHLSYLTSCRCDILLRYQDKIMEVENAIKAKKEEEEAERKKQEEAAKTRCKPFRFWGSRGSYG